MTTKKINTLVEDIYTLFDPNVTHTPNEDNLNEVAETIKGILRTRLAEREPIGSPLRFSSLGKPDRQIWYMAHPEEGEPPEELTAKTYFKFLYGDLIETLLLFLAKESGHTVERMQEEIEVDGVKGHIDAIIDGVVVDVKSASPFGYQKFKTGDIFQDDPFGYVHQLAGYADVLTPGEPAAWIPFDKVGGDITVTTLPTSIIKDNLPAPRIEQLKKVVEPDAEIPPRCYEPVPDGKSGNLKLPTPCAYCAFKHRCHTGLRTFLYSTGPRYLTKVVKVPDVRELIVGTPDEPEVTD